MADPPEAQMFHVFVAGSWSVEGPDEQMRRNAERAQKIRLSRWSGWTPGSLSAARDAPCAVEREIWNRLRELEREVWKPLEQEEARARRALLVEQRKAAKAEERAWKIERFEGRRYNRLSPPDGPASFGMGVKLCGPVSGREVRPLPGLDDMEVWIYG